MKKNYWFSIPFLLLPLSVFGDFSPQSPGFPHGTGIIHTEGSCNESDNACSSGLNFPSFNNYTDTYVNSAFIEGITDERRFLVIQNLGPDGVDTKSSYGNEISVNIDDYIYVRAYIHNNGHFKDSKTTASNVRLGISDFQYFGDDNYYSSSGKEITITQFISSDNTTPKKVTDTASVVSSSGKLIRLLYVAKNKAVQASTSISGTKHIINIKNFISSQGDNIGAVKGCAAESFYTWTLMRVVEGADPVYNLSLEKTVGLSVETAIHKTMNASPGDVLTYKLHYKNDLTSKAAPKGTKIYDDYDQSKLKVVWLPDNPKECIDNGDKIICDAYDLQPIKDRNTHTFYYTAQIKSGATGVIINKAEIKPTLDKDSKHSDDTSTAIVNISSTNTGKGGGSFDFSILFFALSGFMIRFIIFKDRVKRA